MAFTTPNLSLESWNLTSDLFDHTQLHNNNLKVDEHDHSTGKGVQIPSAGLVDGAVTSGKLASGAALANLASSSVTDAKLASPANSMYRAITFHNAISRNGDGAGDFYFRPDTNGLLSATSSISNLAPFLIYLSNSDYTIPNKTAVLRTRIAIAVNNVAPSATYKVGVYPINSTTSSGGSITLNAGSVVSSSQAIATTPSANSLTSFTSSDFSFPADGMYVMGLNISGNPASGTATIVTGRLEYRHT